MTEILSIFYGVYHNHKQIKKICIAAIIIACCFMFSLYLIVQTVFAVLQGTGRVVDSANGASAFSEFQSFAYKTIKGEQWFTFSSPYSFPTLGSLTEGVIVDSSVNHAAWNIADTPSRQTEVRSFAVGTVLAVNDNILRGTTQRWKFCDESGLGICWYDDGVFADVQTGCGNEIKIQHPDGLVTQYCHLAALPVLKIGDPVASGQVIGYQGSTGWAKSKYLYFAMFRNGQPIDPAYAFTQTRLSNWGQ